MAHEFLGSGDHYKVKPENIVPYSNVSIKPTRTELRKNFLSIAIFTKNHERAFFLL